MKRMKHVISIILGVCFPLAGQAQADTVRAYALPEVTVTDSHRIREVRSVAPVQSLSREELEHQHALQLSDAVKRFSGVTVKDYGGVGGLKTVSVRSLGAQHTVIGYDGIAITDCQTGQIDLGRFSLENVSRVALSNGQDDNIFQPARFFASAGVLHIETLAPEFEAEERTHLRAKVKAGSWGVANPSLRIERKAGRKWALTGDAEWMSSDGRYPFTLYYGDENDASSREKRQNTEVRALRAEAGLYGTFSIREQWRLKAYYYQSSRGLPAAATYYYNHFNQHLWDKNAFVQSNYRKEFGRRFALRLAGKWNWSYQRYLNPDYKGSTGQTENNYYQQEYYLSASALWRALDNLSFSLAMDGSVNRMNADLHAFAKPVRCSWLTALAGKYVTDRMTLSASVLATWVHEDAERGNSAGMHRKLSPYVGVSFKPFAAEEFRLRAFYKDIFRLPSFNDLYYGQTGNIGLKPEKARQLNVGLTYTKRVCDVIPFLTFTADAYMNRVTDKIVAIPTKNLFVWSMVNLGKVNIKGMDVTGSLGIRPCEGYVLNLSGNYTYQRALDVTDSDPSTAEGKTYKHQIAYTPRVSGSGQAVLETPWADLSYAVLFSGKRYMLGQNIAENRLPGYTDHSVSARREFRWRDVSASVAVEVLNLADKNYEIVKNFPMPGRSFRVTVGIDY